MIILSWICTILILLGFYLNARQKLKLALITWMFADVGWVIFNFHIQNYAGLFQCAVIILINLYGIYHARTSRIKN